MTAAAETRNTGDRDWQVCLVQVISGFQLPYKSEKVLKAERALSVQVRVIGIDDDIQSDRTKLVKNNGQLVVLSSLVALCAISIFYPHKPIG